MSYKSEPIWIAVVVLATAVIVAVSIIYANIGGKELARTDILEQCQNGKSVTIDGIEIHCGVISSDVNLEAARYNAVKQCVKLIGAWNDG
jgi:hypothetical protein